MACLERHISFITLLVLLQIFEVHLATVKDIFTTNSEVLKSENQFFHGDLLKRVRRENNKYYNDRYDTDTSTPTRTLKPEENSENSNAKKDEKRCSTCDTGYSRPYDSTTRYRGGSRDRYDDRYDDRSFERYDRSRYPSSTRDSYYDRYDRYDRDRYVDRDRYGGDRDRSYDRRYEDYYDRDYYGREYGGGRDRYSDRYDRYSDRYDDRRDRYSDRGVGYDNRGYDYRGSSERYDGYRPWDETSRGYSGIDLAGRGYYPTSGKPDYGSYGTAGVGGYASGWNYGGAGRDDYRDRGYGSYGSYGGYRSRDPYYDGGYRYTTSYLYGRPSSTTTDNPKLSDNNINGGSGTSSPSQNSNNSG